MEPLGHLDFYPNGGARQPGCPSSDLRSAKNVSSTNLIDDLENDPSCSHMRVLDLYSESFLSDGCQSIGYKCSDYESFQKVENVLGNSRGKKKMLIIPLLLRVNAQLVDQIIASALRSAFKLITIPLETKSTSNFTSAQGKVRHTAVKMTADYYVG